MSDRTHPVGALNPPQVITFPADIDIGNAEQVEEGLRAAFADGAAVVVADLTRTRFCDTSGARALLIAAKAADTARAELRIALPDRSALRTLRLLGLDHLLRIYPTVAEALIT